MAQKIKGAWLIARGLDPELVARFQDFCEGYQGAPDYRLIARALEHYMADRYEAEPEVKRRADEARAKRLSGA
jgi:hypothetical protein